MTTLVNLKGRSKTFEGVYIGRGNSLMWPWLGKSSSWANPFTVKQFGRAESVDRYRSWIAGQLASGALNLDDLRGKTLGCWCSPEACHGDVLLDLLDAEVDADN